MRNSAHEVNVLKLKFIFSLVKDALPSDSLIPNLFFAFMGISLVYCFVSIIIRGIRQIAKAHSILRVAGGVGIGLIGLALLAFLAFMIYMGVTVTLADRASERRQLEEYASKRRTEGKE
jgi:protein-S-isoprenylcysteine O-methyltransferase Ste14